MKIGNAFSLNMVSLPANAYFIRMPLERIKDMITDSTEKQMARKLITDRRISVIDDDERIVIEFDKKDGKRTWAYWEFMLPNNPGYTDQVKIINDLGLAPGQDGIVDLIAAKDADLVQLESMIGHIDTAKIISGMLGVELPMNRKNVKLAQGEKMIVAQYSGPRLPEGATTLPEGAKIEFVLVEMEK
jgi:hypothetical protein